MATSIFVVAPFAGPSIGPVVGGFLSDAGVKWNILFWVLFAFAGFCAVLAVFTLPYVSPLASVSLHTSPNPRTAIFCCSQGDVRSGPARPQGQANAKGAPGRALVRAL